MRLHVLLLAVVGELVGLLIVIVVSDVNVDVVLGVLTMLSILSMLRAVVQGALSTLISSRSLIAHADALGLHWI